MSQTPGTEQSLNVIAVIVDKDEMVIKTLEMYGPHLEIQPERVKEAILNSVISRPALEVLFISNFSSLGES